MEKSAKKANTSFWKDSRKSHAIPLLKHHCLNVGHGAACSHEGQYNLISWAKKIHHLLVRLYGRILGRCLITETQPFKYRFIQRRCSWPHRSPGIRVYLWMNLHCSMFSGEQSVAFYLIPHSMLQPHWSTLMSSQCTVWSLASFFLHPLPLLEMPSQLLTSGLLAKFISFFKMQFKCFHLHEHLFWPH